MGSLHKSNSASVRKRIESHTFDDEGGEEYGASAFGGFGDYMRRKKIKLQNLDAEIRSSATDCPPIFRGVVVHVNGYTQPSLQDLHRMVVGHGGGFLQYLDGKTAATHIIASSLTPKKREEFRRYRIVKPAWVVESIKAGRMLPWDAFRVVDEGQSQKVLKFDNGRVSSQSSSPRVGYKEQTSSSWYTSQLKASESETRTPIGQSPLAQTTTPAATDQLQPAATQSDYGEFPSFTELDEPRKESTSPTPGPAKERESASQLEDNISRTPRSPSSPPRADPATVSPHSLQEPARNPDMTSEDYNVQLLSDPRMRNASGTNPEFIQQYYRESRLHHLSTWKAELKAQLQSAAREKSQSQVRRRKPSFGARRYIMHVDFDCFFAAVGLLKHPELEGKPVAVAHGPGTGSEIASCNYVARGHGIKNGMWMKGALQTCPELKVLPYDFPAYEDASRKFYKAILAIDGVVQSVSIDEALVDITNQCLEAGGTDGRGISEGSIYREQAEADHIAEQLRASIKQETGCAVSVGIGGNILQAKVALRKAKPAGQFQLKPDAVLDFIGKLTVQDLPGVGYSLGAKLEEIGVKFVKDARDLNRERLSAALGPKTGAKIWDYSRGIDRTEIGTEVLRKSVSAEVNWGIRFVNQTQADDFVRNLCEELHRRLVENLVKGKQLTLKVMRRSADAPLEPVKHLGHGKCDVFNKSVILGVATNATDVLGKEAISMLKSFGVSPGDLRGLGVQMTKLEPLKSGNSGIESSQRQLDFKASPVRKSVEKHADPDILDSPRKGESETLINAPSLNDSHHKPLNISGSQFIMPSQPDPAVVAELPNDIRSKLVAQGKPLRDSRSVSPCPPPAHRPRPESAGAELPPQSQLDPDTLMALPEDVRAEVLGYYTQTPDDNTAAPPPPDAAPAAIPNPRPAAPGSLRFKRPTTPTKKRRGRPSTKAVGNMTLTQANFLSRTNALRETPQQQPTRQPSPPPEDIPVSADFLAALPEDIRREVLEEQKRVRLRQRPGTGPPTAAVQRTATAQSRPAAPAPQPPAQERKLALPPLPERPAFTSQKLSGLPELREALAAWHSAFGEGGPFADDVDSLARYLKRVVLEEKDMEKAVSVVRWLMWLAGEAEAEGGSSGEKSPRERMEGTVSWDEAVQALQDSINEGLEERDLPPVDF